MFCSSPSSSSSSIPPFLPRQTKEGRKEGDGKREKGRGYLASFSLPISGCSMGGGGGGTPTKTLSFPKLGKRGEGKGEKRSSVLSRLTPSVPSSCECKEKTESPLEKGNQKRFFVTQFYCRHNVPQNTDEKIVIF